jgi:short-subunit dehydrogenase
MAWEIADVTNGPLLREKVSDLERRLGPVEVLIASAGVGMETSALDLKVEDFQAVIQANLLGVVSSIAAVLPGMLERRRGHVVAISSLASFLGLPRMLAYSASKAGVNALMDGLRVEVRPFNIVVSTVCPGWVRTPMTENHAARIPRLMSVEDAARRILWAIHRRKPFYAFPFALAWQVRVLSYLPRRFREWLLGRAISRTRKPRA